MELFCPSLKISPKSVSDILSKNVFLIFQEIELSSLKIKNFLILLRPQP